MNWSFVSELSGTLNQTWNGWTRHQLVSDTIYLYTCKLASYLINISGRHTDGRISTITTGSYDTEDDYRDFLTPQDIEPSTSDESDVSRLTMEYPSDSSGGYSTDEGNSVDNMSLDDNDHHGGDDHDRQDNDSLLSSLCARITRLLQAMKISKDR